MIDYAVLGGFVLDAIFGDPAWLPHPVVYMGKAISALEKGLRARLPKTPEGELWGGRILAFCLPVGTFALILFNVGVTYTSTSQRSTNSSLTHFVTQPVHQGCRRRGRQELGSQLRPQQPLSLCAERRPA